MNGLIRWGTVTVIAAGAILAGAAAVGRVAAGWWIFWAACAAVAVGSNITARRADRQ